MLRTIKNAKLRVRNSGVSPECKTHSRQKIQKQSLTAFQNFQLSNAFLRRAMEGRRQGRLSQKYKKGGLIPNPPYKTYFWDSRELRSWEQGESNSPAIR